MPSFSLVLKIFAVPLLLSSFLSLLATYFVKNIYLRRGWLDDPSDSNHPKVVHTYPVPRGGGVAIFVAILFSAVFFLGLDRHVLGILLGGLVIATVGFFDDKMDLNPYLRLVLGFVAASLVVVSGIGIAFITNPFGEGVLHLDWPRLSFSLFGQTHSIWLVADIFALIWIVWNMNMVNWSKGIDGQLPGVVVVAAVVIAILSFRFTEDVTQWNVSILAAITAGAYLGFLFWNFYPQKIMPGYGGGSLAGYLLAILAILSGAKVAALILVLGVPTMDAVYTIIRRLLRRKSPVWGDRGHLHHRLLDIGWSKKKVALFYWSISAFLGLLSIQLNATQKFYTIVSLSLVVGGVLLWLKSFSFSLRAHDLDSGLKT